MEIFLIINDKEPLHFIDKYICPILRHITKQVNLIHSYIHESGYQNIKNVKTLRDKMNSNYIPQI